MRETLDRHHVKSLADMNEIRNNPNVTSVACRFIRQLCGLMPNYFGLTGTRLLNNYP
jgi:hypothetical protein